MSTVSYLFLVLLWTQANCQDRGDVLPEVETDGISTSTLEECSCSSKVAGAIILTIIIMLIITAIAWCFYNRRKERGRGKVDVEAAGKAAYDNPQFQADEYDPCGDITRRDDHQVSCSSTCGPSGGRDRTTKLASTATNTTSTLERGKATLERVMAAVISSGKSFSPKKTKDDSFLLEPRIVAVPLQAHDFTGLGFTVHGNLRDGIYVKEVLSRGPATESKQVAVGDKVAALTVFFDHMVYEDACTILSYALPYPVLLHLEKNQSPYQLPGLIGTPPKGKKIPPSPSTKLLHPIFRSQSHSELVKISSMDIKKLRLGNIASPKNKGISPLSIGVEVPKIHSDQFPQRHGQTRHSERAIDVPGAEIKTKISSCEVNFSDVDAEKVGLANVQVHRPMSPAVGIEIPDQKINIKACQEAPITDITETLSGPKISKNDQKCKFGVKVLPDLGFQKNASKDVDLVVGLEGGIDTPDASHLNTEIQIENELTDKNRQGMKLPGIGLNAKLPKLSGEVKDESPKGTPVCIEIPEPEIEVADENEKHKEKSKNKGKFGFGFGSLDFRKNSVSSDDSKEDESKKKTETTNESNTDFGISVDGPNWKVPSFDLKLKQKDKNFPKGEKAISLKKEVNLEAASPDITAPKSPEITLEPEVEFAQTKNSSNQALESKGSIDIKLKKPDIGLPPAFHFKKSKSNEDGKNADHDSDNERQKHKVKRKGSKSDGDSSGFGISIKRPDIKLPSFDIRHDKSTKDEDGEKESEDERKDKKERKKSKDKTGFNFKFKAPDFSFPSFGGKDEKSPEAEVEIGKGEIKSEQVEIPKVDVEKQNNDLPSKNIDLSIKMPDFVSNIQEIKVSEPEGKLKDSNLNTELPSGEVTMPEFKLRNKVEVDKIDLNGKVSPPEIELTTPNLELDKKELVEAVNIDANLPDFKREASENIEISQPDVGKMEKSENESSNWKLDLRAPDISLPSFNLRKKENEKDAPDEICKEGNQLNLNFVKPDVSLSSSELSVDPCHDQDKNKFKLGMKLPDVALPTFGFNIDKKNNAEASPELLKAKVELDTDLKDPSVALSDDENLRRLDRDNSFSPDVKGDLSAELRGPDLNLTKPNFTNKETVVVNLNVGEHPKVDFIPPDVTALRSKFSEGTREQKNESEGETKETHEDGDDSSNKKGKKKKGFGFKIKAPDFEMPDFRLKHGHKQYSLDESESNVNIKQQPNVSKTVSLEGKYTGASGKVDTNLQMEKNAPESAKEDVKKKKSFGFNLKMPDITLPDFKFKSGDKSNEEHTVDLTPDISSKENITIEGKLPEMDLVVENENNENVSRDRKEDKREIFKLDADINPPEPLLEKPSKISEAEDKVDCQSKMGLNIKMPGLKLPDIDLSSKNQEKEDLANKDQQQESNKEENDQGNLEDDLNATDATKKKRFGIKFNQPNIKLPNFSMAKDRSEDKHDDIENCERNQSDEMKSLHLKLKAPSVEIPGLTDNSANGFSANLNSGEDESKLSLSDELKTTENINISLSDDDLQKKSDEWKIKEMNDTSKEVEYTIPSIGETVKGSFSSQGSKDASFNVRLPELKADVHSINDKDARITTKEIFGVKLKSPKISSIESDIDSDTLKFESAEADKNMHSEVKVSTASLKLSSSDLAMKNPFSLEAEKDSTSPKVFSGDFVTDSKVDITSMEIESDLPEADSDLKIKPIDLPEVDISMTKVVLPRIRNESELTLQTENINDLKNDTGENYTLKSEIPNIETSIIQATSVVSENVSKDLPEVDIDMNTHGVDKNTDLVIQPPKFAIPQTLEYSINRSGNVEKEKKEPRALDYSSDSESDSEKPKKVGVDLDMKIKKNDEQKALVSTKPKTDTDEEDKAKNKGKLGLGFGFRGFGRSSDSEDTEAENKISNDPSNSEIKEKKRFGGKMSFGIKNFGRSSSDTEEENSDVKVSETPMQKESEKAATKSQNLGFGFKAKVKHSSDSEDTFENEKFEVEPDAEAFTKKGKAKLSAKAEEDTKGRVKTFSFTSRSSKDSKSESEVGEDEKSSLETRDDPKGKHKYGLGFGFRKNSGKSTSDSEGGEFDEKKVSMDAKGVNEKSKEHKSKSLKLGFKPFKNLKGKIQTEINKMRHDSSDEELPVKLEEAHTQGEKRKKVPKKKEKDKKIKQTEDPEIEISEEMAMSSAAMAAKENRRKRLSRSSSSSSSSSSESSSDEDDDVKHVDKKKKKKSKAKRKEEGRVLTTGVMEVDVANNDGTMEVDEQIVPYQRQINLIESTFADGEELQKVSLERQTINFTKQSSYNEDKVVAASDEEKTPKRYVVVKEMKLKQSAPSIEVPEVNEVVEKITIERKIPSTLLMEERTSQVYTDTDGGSWGSDSDMERTHKSEVHASLSATSVNLDVPGKQKGITDSEELKRRAASLGDLSRLHEGAGVGNLLERAVSLDLKTVSVGPPNLHVRRLRLPDSSATSIDEVDEALALPSPKKLDASGGLKAASRWGTLEDALLLERTGMEYQDMEVPDTDGNIIKTTNGEGVSISNIEISGGKGSSVTALSSGRGSWNESFDEETPPALPTSPVPHGTTTITVTDNLSNSSISDQNVSDASIVIVPSEHSSNGLINLNVQSHNIASQLPALESKMSINLMQDTFDMNEINSKMHKTTQEEDSIGITYAPKLQILSDREESLKSPDVESSMQIQSDRDDSGGVTITMIPAEDHSFMNVTSVSTNPPPVPPKPKSGKTTSSPPDLLSYDSGIQTQLVTVNHDWIKENGDILKENETNLSDEYLTPDATPQKSMTQITLDGDGLSGYTVTEGTFSRTVIISNPDSNPVSIVQTDGEASLPLLHNSHE